MSQSRRQFLKVMAAAPLLLPLGLTASPLMRYLKPTMSPLGFCDPADQPGCAEVVSFTLSDFPQPWAWLPFVFPLEIEEFNPEQHVIREIQAFIFRTEGSKFVAYSRVCPKPHGYLCYLSVLSDPSLCHCGCFSKSERCSSNIANPVLFCPCTGTTFDLANEARVISGTAPRPPRKFDLERRGDMIAVVRLEPGAVC